MATYKTNIVSARDSGDEMASQGLCGHVKRIIARTALTGAITTSDVLLICRLPIDARITSVKIHSDDLGTTGDLHFGFHQVGDNNTAGTVIDADALATAVDVNAAALTGSELRYEVNNISTSEEKVWELANLSARPEYGDVFLTATPSEDTTAAGDITIYVDFQV